MRKGLLGFGIALIVFAVIITPVVYIYGTSELAKLDPEKDDDTIRITASGEIKTILKGEYDIWFEKDPGDLTILGPEGQEIDIKKDSSVFPIEGKERYGIFEAELTGIYTFTYGGGSLYITPSIDTTIYDNVILAGIILGALMIIVGIILAIVGMIMKPKFSILDYRREQMRRGGIPPRKRSASPPVQGGELKSDEESK